MGFESIEIPGQCQMGFESIDQPGQSSEVERNP